MGYKKIYEVKDTRTNEKVDYIKVVTEQDIERMKEREKINEAKYMGRKRRFINIKHDPLRTLIQRKGLSFREAGAFVKLMPYISYNERVLKINDKNLRQKDIAKILSKSEKNTREIIKILDSKFLIHKVRDGKGYKYLINDYYAYIGENRNTKSLFTKLYLTPIKSVGNSLTLEELGFMFMIIPFFHFSTYSLCWNPDEEKEELIDFLNKKDLANALNVSERTVYTHFKKLNDKGYIMFVKVYGIKSYILNPNIMTRMKHETEIYNENYNTISKMFEKHKQQKKKDN